MACDNGGRIARVGLRAHACAVGQAAAAIFAHSAPGRDREEIAASRAALTAWLAGTGAAPQWPGLDALASALAYPARHGAMLLPWTAALAALPSV